MHDCTLSYTSYVKYDTKSSSRAIFYFTDKKDQNANAINREIFCLAEF